MTRFWRSDDHIGHHNIIEFCNRPFWHEVPVLSVFGEGTTQAPDVEAMNQALLDNHNDVVRPTDEVWIVGDLAMGVFAESVAFAAKFHGRKYLIPGNHDRCHRMHPKWRKFQPTYEAAGITVLDSEVRTKVGNTDVLVCHFPYRFTHISDDRYSAYRPEPIDGWLFHGHTHSTKRVDYESRSLHVGVDAWDLFPVSEATAEVLISVGPDGSA